jgi:hypothetical protein
LPRTAGRFFSEADLELAWGGGGQAKTQTVGPGGYFQIGQPWKFLAGFVGEAKIGEHDPGKKAATLDDANGLPERV